MTMLNEKKAELTAKLQSLLAEREKRHIDALTAYKAQLEAEPYSEEILATKKVLTAIDEMIAYEANYEPAKVEIKAEEIVKVEEIPVEEVPAQAEIVEAVEIKEEQPTEEVKVEIPTENKETITVTTPATPAMTENLARPGMAYVGIPERR